ncbi:antitoxin [Streptococcus suis]|uniref:antitoxin n=1 Tax=Streptococcus suis TaxID=1307 RepID=UPI00237CE553|nr:antitoxin [Streptococcus suis]MDE1691212.1 antitoxin [Streptococcus suis]
MANTKPVNFIVDATFYEQTREPKEYVNSDIQVTEFQVAFEGFKKEILIGHQKIEQGKLTSLAVERKDFVLE